MSELLGGIYLFDKAASSLSRPDTNQTIHLAHFAAGGGYWFEYTDDDFHITFVVEKTFEANRSIALVDFNRAECKELQSSYGKWRRLSFFLLDCLPVWFFGTKFADGVFWRLDCLGGWTNSRWQQAAVIQSVLINPNSADLKSAARLDRRQLTALSTLALSWTFHNALNPNVEAELRFNRSEESGVNTPYCATPMEEQLQNVPHFARADGKAVLYHRYVRTNFFRGEDYDPIPYYGFASGNCAYSIRATRFYGVDTFLHPSDVAQKIDGNAAVKTAYNANSLTTFTPSESMREDLLYSLIDINAVMDGLGIEMPIVPERDDRDLQFCLNDSSFRFPTQRGVRFGSYLDTVSGLPVSRCLGMTSMSIGQRYGQPIKPRNLSF